MANPAGPSRLPRLESWVESGLRAIRELGQASPERRATVLADILEGSQPTLDLLRVARDLRADRRLRADHRQRRDADRRERRRAADDPDLRRRARAHPRRPAAAADRVDRGVRRRAGRGCALLPARLAAVLARRHTRAARPDPAHADRSDGGRARGHRGRARDDRRAGQPGPSRCRDRDRAESADRGDRALSRARRLPGRLGRLRSLLRERARDPGRCRRDVRLRRIRESRRDRIARRSGPAVLRGGGRPAAGDGPAHAVPGHVGSRSPNPAHDQRDARSRARKRAQHRARRRRLRSQRGRRRGAVDRAHSARGSARAREADAGRPERAARRTGAALRALPADQGRDRDGIHEPAPLPRLERKGHRGAAVSRDAPPAAGRAGGARGRRHAPRHRPDQHRPRRHALGTDARRLDPDAARSVARRCSPIRDHAPRAPRRSAPARGRAAGRLSRTSRARGASCSAPRTWAARTRQRAREGERSKRPFARESRLGQISSSPRSMPSRRGAAGRSARRSSAPACRRRPRSATSRREPRRSWASRSRSPFARARTSSSLVRATSRSRPPNRARRRRLPRKSDTR